MNVETSFGFAEIAITTLGTLVLGHELGRFGLAWMSFATTLRRKSTLSSEKGHARFGRLFHGRPGGIVAVKAIGARAASAVKALLRRLFLLVWLQVHTAIVVDVVLSAGHDVGLSMGSTEKVANGGL